MAESVLNLSILPLNPMFFPFPLTPVNTIIFTVKLKPVRKLIFIQIIYYSCDGQGAEKHGVGAHRIRYLIWSHRWKGILERLPWRKETEAKAQRVRWSWTGEEENRTTLLQASMPEGLEICGELGWPQILCHPSYRKVAPISPPLDSSLTL